MSAQTANHVLIATERKGWAFDNIAKQLARRLCHRYQFAVLPFTRVTTGEYDITISLWWGALCRVKGSAKAHRHIACVYDGLSWCIDAAARKQFELALRNSDGLVVCNQAFMDQIKSEFAQWLPPVVWCIPDGIDLQMFPYMPLPDQFTAGWTGNSSRMTPGGPTDHKGLNYIREACTQTPGVALHILDAAQTGPQTWPLEKMPEFYAEISTFVCASYMEGAPNPLLEAMACGRPCISTRVGLAPQLIKEGVTGYFIERDAQSISSMLSLMAKASKEQLTEMGRAACKAVQQFSWEKQAQSWQLFLEETWYAQRLWQVDPPAQIRQPTASVETVKPSIPKHTAKRARKPEEKPRLLLISDVRGWAFHSNNIDAAEYLQDVFDIEHYFVEDFLVSHTIPDFAEYDVIYSPYHRWPIHGLFPFDHTLGSLRSQWMFPERKRKPQHEEFSLANQFRAFHTVTKSTFEEYQHGVPNLSYITNPVNMRRFPNSVSDYSTVTVSWNGNAKHNCINENDQKGISTIIQPACKATRVQLCCAEYESKRLRRDEMPSFYLQANTALCASQYEGASNSVMEAMAAGLILIATDVGNHREMQESQRQHLGDTGIVLVERSAEAFSEALYQLQNIPSTRRAEMGQLNRESIAADWSWDAWVDRYCAFLQIPL